MSRRANVKREFADDALVSAKRSRTNSGSTRSEDVSESLEQTPTRKVLSQIEDSITRWHTQKIGDPDTWTRNELNEKLFSLSKFLTNILVVLEFRYESALEDEKKYLEAVSQKVFQIVDSMSKKKVTQDFVERIVVAALALGVIIASAVHDYPHLRPQMHSDYINAIFHAFDRDQLPLQRDAYMIGRLRNPDDPEKRSRPPCKYLNRDACTAPCQYLPQADAQNTKQICSSTENAEQQTFYQMTLENTKDILDLQTKVAGAVDSLYNYANQQAHDLQAMVQRERNFSQRKKLQSFLGRFKSFLSSKPVIFAMILGASQAWQMLDVATLLTSSYGRHLTFFGEVASRAIPAAYGMYWARSGNRRIEQNNAYHKSPNRAEFIYPDGSFLFDEPQQKLILKTPRRAQGNSPRRARLLQAASLQTNTQQQSQEQIANAAAQVLANRSLGL